MDILKNIKDNSLDFFKRNERVKYLTFMDLYLRVIFFITVFICYPITLWATRGSQDYGIMNVVVFFVYTIPVGITLLCFIFYLITKLKRGIKLGKSQGKIVFILSGSIIAFSILLALLLMHSSKWHPTMVELMLANFIPILMMATASFVLAFFVKKRSLKSDDEIKQELSSLKSDKPGIAEKRTAKIIIIVFIVLVILFIFKYYFT